MSRRRRKPLPKDPVTTSVEGLSHEGRGVAHVDGKTVFLHNALQGESVDFTYTHRNKAYDEGMAATIHTPSSDRVPAKCDAYLNCGGCSLQHMAMEKQLSVKQNTLLEQLKHFGNLTPNTLLSPLHVNEWGYRRKARLGVRFVPKKERVLVGFREMNGRYVADMKRCETLHPRIGELIEALSKLIQSLDAYQQLPQVEIAMGDEEAALIFRHLVPLSDHDKEALIAFGKQHALHIYAHPNKPDPVTCIWPEMSDERLTYALPKHNIEIKFHPMDFTQVNAELNQAMVDLAIQYLALTPTDRVLDLFCGLGNFSLPIARYCEHVTGVEGDVSATKRARDNAKHNALTNTSFYTANLFEDCSHLQWAQQSYDKLLIDPPRTGAEAIISLLPTLAPSKIVYISCNPATLARDAGNIVALGYTLNECGIMNMFPHTTHVESIAVFEKKM